MPLPSCRKFIGCHRTVVHLKNGYCVVSDMYRRVYTLKQRTVCSDTRNNSKAEKSVLYKHLQSRILAGGPITVADYMKQVLTCPDSGYYMKKDVFGKDGDFTTSPEISQLFGEMIAVWTVNEWRKICNHSVQLVELGPGRGTLSKDILRVYKKLGISEKVSLHLVEISPTLAALQAKTLCKTTKETKANDVLDNNGDRYYYKEGKTGDGVNVYWYSSIYDVPRSFSIIIAHEFFDALPIHKFQKTSEGWREILIDIDPIAGELEKFRYIVARSATPSSKFYIHDDEKRDHVETSPQSAVIIDYMAKFLVENGGFALIADYGHNGDRSDTFRAFRHHKQHDPLLEPGSADLTADVDFSLLKRIACQEDRLISFGPVTQHNFLKELGVDARLMILLRNAFDDQSKETIISGYRMITDPQKMGNCFKFVSFFPAVLKDHLCRWPVTGFQTTLAIQ